MTQITDLPQEILDDILHLATAANQAAGEGFSYGLSQIPGTLDRKARITKYVRGPLSAECLRWDATQSIRQVCRSWHEWALAYNLEHVFERRWRGAERWADLPINRQNYPLYELNERPLGYAVYRDPYGSLRQTDALFSSYPAAARHVRRLWFNGFHTAETDRLMLSVVSRCTDLVFLSVPWTALRRGTAQDWRDLLNKTATQGRPLRSLELTAVGLTADQAAALKAERTSPSPLADPSVDFSSLKRLKIFGNTPHNPVNDGDLELIARSATNLEHLDLTNLSTISVAGMLALVRASQKTLQVLEHSPRSDDGFFHPFPGHALDVNEHVCTLLTSLPKLRDLSISIPYLCEDLFTNYDVNWTGECQVRTTDLCGCSDANGTGTHERVEKLRRVFSAARGLVAARKRVGHDLAIEIFFAGCIFEPEKGVVHGDFAWACFASHGAWPASAIVGEDGRRASTKGPYGTSGVWDGKEEGALWDVVSEEEYLTAVGRGWITL